MTPEPIPAVAGWFTTDDEPRLLGLRDTRTGTYFFPRETAVSRPPQALCGDLEEVELSHTGTLWSYTTNHYAPPEPYVSPDPFEPYTVAAVELAEEKMVVLGQVAHGVDPESLEIGMELELVLEPLWSDDEGDHVVWKWKPAATDSEADR